MLKAAGLVAPSTHTISYTLRPQDPLPEVRSRWRDLIEYADALGVHYLGGSTAVFRSSILLTSISASLSE
jgi:hypothetical protein